MAIYLFKRFFFQLATRVAFHDHLLPVCLPSPDMKELPAGTNCTVIGWGKKEDKNCEFAWDFISLFKATRLVLLRRFVFLHAIRSFLEQWKALLSLPLTGIQFPFEFLFRLSLSLFSLPALGICPLFRRRNKLTCVNVCRGLEAKGSKYFSTSSHVCFRKEDDTEMFSCDTQKSALSGKGKFHLNEHRELLSLSAMRHRQLKLLPASSLLTHRWSLRW